MKPTKKVEGKEEFENLIRIALKEMKCPQCAHTKVDYECPCFHDGFETADAENGYEWKKQRAKVMEEIDIMDIIQELERRGYTKIELSSSRHYFYKSQKK